MTGKRGAWIVPGNLVVFSEPLPTQRSWPVGLSAAERAVAEATLEGDTIAEIARRRGVGPSTVRKQLCSLYAKAGVRSRAELLAKVSAGATRRRPR